MTEGDPTADAVMDNEESYKKYNAFKEYECELFKRNVHQMWCMVCEVKGTLVNHGVGGKHNQGGFFLLQLKCEPGKGGCGKTGRLATMLQEYAPEAEVMHKNALNYFIIRGRAAMHAAKPVAGPGLKQKTLIWAGEKRHREPSSTTDEQAELQQIGAKRTNIRKNSENDQDLHATFEAAEEDRDAAGAGAQQNANDNMPLIQNKYIIIANTSAKGIENAPNDGGVMAVQAANPYPGVPNPAPQDEQEAANPTEFWKHKFTEQAQQLAKLYELIGSLTAQVADLTNAMNTRNGPAPTPGSSQKPVQIMQNPARKAENIFAKPGVVQAPAQPSYAQKAATAAPTTTSNRTIRRRAETLFEVRDSKPLEFAKIYVKVGNPRSLKQAKTAREANQIVSKAIASLGVKKDVFLYSKIGNSMIELYVPADKRTQVAGQIKWSGGVIDNNFDAREVPVYGKQTPEQVGNHMVKRLAYLYRRARLVNLKKCILDGYREEVKVAVREAATQPASAIVAGATGIDLIQ